MLYFCFQVEDSTLCSGVHTALCSACPHNMGRHQLHHLTPTAHIAGECEDCILYIVHTWGGNLQSHKYSLLRPLCTLNLVRALWRASAKVIKHREPLSKLIRIILLSNNYIFWQCSVKLLSLSLLWIEHLHHTD